MQVKSEFNSVFNSKPEEKEVLPMEYDPRNDVPYDKVRPCLSSRLAASLRT